MVTDAVVRIPLGCSALFALVDADEFEVEHSVGFSNGRIWSGRICDSKWQPGKRVGGRIYAKRIWQQSLSLMELLLHRAVMDAPAGAIVDHINGDRLDCRRSNLRFATHKQNARNRVGQGGSSVFKGVTRHKASGKYEANIRVARIKRYLGLFSSEVDAAHAYDAAATTHFGEFARLNFPNGCT